jgi:diguanylate cyclase (GGDEF)-like protein/PAS domain S-box-containing protein
MGSERERIAGVVIADATTAGFPVVYVSPGFEQLTGYRADEVIGETCAILQGPDTDPRAADVLSRALADGREAYVTILNYRRDGTPFWNEVALAAECDAAGRVVRYIGVQKDVTARLQAERGLHEVAHYDPLTGLANQTALHHALSVALESAQVSDTQLAVLLVDIDDFQAVNDTYGYVAGDRVLSAVGDRLRAVVREHDVLARPGGDEFLMLIRNVREAHGLAEDLAGRVVGCLSEPIALAGGQAVRVRASVGISASPDDATTVEDLLGHADSAMHAAKRAGKDRVHLYVAADGASDHLGDPGADITAVAELRRIIAARDIEPVFQPIVSLATDEVVGYEALARGPEGSLLHRPDQLFAAAQACGLVTELDWLCRARAVEVALDVGLGRAAHLFLNVEPSAVGTSCPEPYAEIWARAQAELDLVLEITERAVMSRPAELSRLVNEHRAAGRGIALDDLGADVRSLALLPLIEPDVIKLDLRLVQDRPSAEQSAIVSAVAAESERTGAAVLAEGIETDEHLAVARSLGATLGQGYRWAHPGPLRPHRSHATWSRPVVARPVRPGRTPFEIIAGECVTAEATKSLLLPMSHHLELGALRIGEGAVLLSAFQEARHFTPQTAARYRTLARDASFVSALGVGLSSEPVAGVRGASLAEEDPLAGEWSVVVIAPHFAGALVAQDLGDTGEDRDRRFIFATTYRRDLVISVARTLLERVTPLGVPAVVPSL